MFIVIQDTNAGYIQYVGYVPNKKIALDDLAEDIGVSKVDLNEDELELTELNEDQYNQLVDLVDPAGGQSQEAIDYLESCKQG